jgi:hypothetical protein
MTDRLTVATAAERIYGDRTERHTRAILRLIALGADGPFPGAVKIDPTIPNSPHLIPVREVEAFIKQQKKTK